MPSTKHTSQNPNGRPRSGTGMADALRWALTAIGRGENPVELVKANDGPGKRDNGKRLMAGVLVNNAIAGDLRAVKEIFDRIDGKPVTRSTNETTIDHKVNIQAQHLLAVQAANTIPADALRKLPRLIEQAKGRP